MKILAFQARRFWWKAFSRTVDGVEESTVEDAHEDAVVAFMHIEVADQGEARGSAFKKSLKHLKWLANKRELRNVVLHSFTHLGGENADVDFARGFLEELAARLDATGYAVKSTPYGHFCTWSLDVYGESLAKVWKEF